MRGIRINPWDQTITEVDAPSDYKAYYGLLTDNTHRDFAVDTFTTISLDGRDCETLFLDDEGHLKDGNRCWELEGYPQPLAGLGLILGCDDEGDTISTKLTLDQVTAKVRWTDTETTAEFIGGGESMIDHPVLGRVPLISAGSPVTRPVAK